MQTVLIVIHLMIVVALVGVVLLQRSEGGALGIGGGSGGMMSARGAADALTRTTGYSGRRVFRHLHRARHSGALRGATHRYSRPYRADGAGWR